MHLSMFLAFYIRLICFSQYQLMKNQLLKAVLFICLLQVVHLTNRNLQFSHHVNGYLPEEFPPEFSLFLYDSGKPLDPYIQLAKGNIVLGGGSNTRLPVVLRLNCLAPLVFIDGVCQCQKGSFLMVQGQRFCFSSDGVQGVVTPRCPLIQMRPELYPIQSIAGLTNYRRTYDGQDNNFEFRDWGKTDSQLQRKTNSYTDGIFQPKDFLPSPRQISNRIGSFPPQLQIRNNLNLSMAFVIFGQFLDHDIDLTEAQHKREGVQVQYMNITIPKEDSFFQNVTQFEFTRSQYVEGASPRKFLNMITTWVDGSQVYGSTGQVNCMLRQFRNGKLKVSSGNHLPIIDNFHRAGDIRAIENTILASYHTIFMRQHNRICDELLRQYPQMNDEELFQAARNYVIALLQKVVYKEFLPKLLGDAYDEEIGQWTAYRPDVNPTLSIEFTTGVFRVGHALLASDLHLVNQFGNHIGTTKLRQLFFNQSSLTNDNINNLLRGLSRSPLKEKTPRIIEDLRNLLALDPQNREVKLDLFSLNLQRGRDHGIGTYNDVREQFGLPRITSFEELLPFSSDSLILIRNLQRLYSNPDNLELWIGIIAERPIKNGVLGSLGSRMIGQAFKNIRDADRFWYEGALPDNLVKQIDSTTLSDIVRRNTGIKGIPDDFFKLQN